jgi:uncharacterized protein
MRMNDPETIRAILRECSTIAVVGLSSKPDRPSHGVASYLQSVGYRVIGVNPNEKEIAGFPVYPNLSSVPERIGVVDIFRRSDHVGTIVDEAIKVGARAIWMQEGVMDDGAARSAAGAGLLVVVNRCMLKEHARLAPGETLPRNRNLEGGD